MSLAFLFVVCGSSILDLPVSWAEKSWVMMAWSYVPNVCRSLFTKWFVRCGVQEPWKAESPSKHLRYSGFIPSSKNLRLRSIPPAYSNIVLVSRWVLLRTTTQMRPNQSKSYFLNFANRPINQFQGSRSRYLGFLVSKKLQKHWLYAVILALGL